MKRSLILLTLFAILFQNCARVYYAADNISKTAEADSLAQNHHLIAIAPPTVSIETSEEIDIRALLFQQETLSRDFQKETYSWLLKRKKQGRITAKIQDIDTSNARLRRAGYNDGTPLSPDGICQILGVDGVITSNYLLDKPMSVGHVLESGLLGVAAEETLSPGLQGAGIRPLIHGSWPTLSVSISINDLKTKKMIWNADNTLSVGIFSPEHIVNGLLCDKSRKMPYIIK